MHEITSEAVPNGDIGEVRSISGFEEIRNTCLMYLTDESKLTATECDFVFFPKNEVELSAVLKAMAKRGVKVTFSAARTGLTGGCVPEGGALVSLERMDKYLNLYYDACTRKWRVVAQCSVSLRDLNQKILSKSFPEMEREGGESVRNSLAEFRKNEKSYFYPPDPTERGASLGGTVATNASGARTYRYGPTRAWVRRIRVMLANGEVLNIPRGKFFASPEGEFTVYDSTGNEAVVRIPDYPMPKTKNTSGLFTCPNMDLIDLFIGSEGILGAITEVEVGLMEKQDKISIVQFFDSDDQAVDFVVALREEKRLRPDFIEFYSALAIDLLRNRQQLDPKGVGMPLIPETFKSAVFFELSFDPSAETLHYDPLEEIVRRCGARLENSWAGYEARELERFKVFRHALPETVNAIIAERKKSVPQLHKLGTDLAVPNHRLRDLWDIYQTSLKTAGLEWVAFGHIGNNHIHVNILPNSMEELEQGIALYNNFAKKTVAFGGAVSAEHGIGKMKKEFLPIMFSSEQIRQMAEVKRALDPNLILNPGDMIDIE